MLLNPSLSHVADTCRAPMPIEAGLAADLAFLRRCASSTPDSADETRMPVVLVATGSFCPPHLGHIQMLRAAVDALSPGVQVAGAIMVPSSDKYVQRKAKRAPGHGDESEPPSFKLRAQLLRSMAADVGLDSWLHVSDAEAARRLFYLDVVEDLAKNATNDPDLGRLAPPQLIFVTGCDRWFPLLEHSPGCDGVVVVPRADSAGVPARSSWPSRAHNSPYRVVAAPLSNGVDALSSTKLRIAVTNALETAEVSAGNLQEAVASAAESFMTPLAAAEFAVWVVATKSATSA